MDHNPNRWLVTTLKGACAFILLLGLPTGYFASYSDSIVEILISATGRAPEGFDKFFFIFLPFFIIEIACTAIMMFVAKVIERYNRFKAMRYFNGFYKWKSLQKEKKSNEESYHLLYINITRLSFILSFASNWQPSIRYWRCCDGQVKAGNEIEFHYDILFQQRREKQTKATISIKDVIVLLGNDETECIVLKCSLVANSENSLRIVAYRETMTAKKSCLIENNASIYKLLSSARMSELNNIMNELVAKI